MPFQVNCRQCGTRFEAVKVNNEFGIPIPQDTTYCIWIEWCAICREAQSRRPRRAIAGDLGLNNAIGHGG